MQICKQCRYSNTDGATFCNRCGGHLHGHKNPLIDRIIDKYRLKAKIGGGGFGMVYKAEHVTLSNPFAIKLLHPHLIHNEMMVERFRQEAVLLATLRHENIVQVIDFGNVEGIGFFLVMEWLEGKTFQQHLKEEGPPPVETLLQLFEQLLGAIQYAHNKGIIHRDLKPENLILIPGNHGRRTLKILDFGIARMMDSHEEKRLTETGIAVGTPRYMSPEQAAGDIHLVDHRTDLYACGVLLVELLTGKQLFSGTTNEILIHHMDTPAPLLREIAPDHPYPLELEEVVAKALAKEREARFQSADDFTNALFEAFNTDPTAVSREMYSPRASQYGQAIQQYQSDIPSPTNPIQQTPQPYPTNPPIPTPNSILPNTDPSAITRALPPSHPKQPHDSGGYVTGSQFLGEQQPQSVQIQTPNQNTSDKESSNVAKWMWATVGLMSGLMLVLLFFVLGSLKTTKTPKEQTNKLTVNIPSIPPENRLKTPLKIHNKIPKNPSLKPSTLDQTIPHTKQQNTGIFYTLFIIPETQDIQAFVNHKKLTGTPPWQVKLKKLKKLKIKFSKKGYVSEIFYWTAKKDQTIRPLLKKKSHKKYRKKRYKRVHKATKRRYKRSSYKKRLVSLTIRTIPSGAMILLDDVYKGKSPLRIRSPQGQRVKIFIKKKQYLSKWFYWKALKNKAKTIRLAEDIF